MDPRNLAQRIMDVSTHFLIGHAPVHRQTGICLHCPPACDVVCTSHFMCASGYAHTQMVGLGRLSLILIVVPAEPGLHWRSQCSADLSGAFLGMHASLGACLTRLDGSCVCGSRGVQISAGCQHVRWLCGV